MSTDSFIDLLEKCKGDFYQKQGKNTFFKKSQKMDCAKEINKNFSLEDMISNTIYIVPATNKIIFLYPVFKLYATSENYEKIMQKVLNLYDEVLNVFPTYEAHVLLDTFTISAAERYKEAIILFCNKCMDSSPKYTDLLTAMYIYYTPSMIDNISILLRPFINPLVRDRIILYNKSESEPLWKQLTQK
jgi:hypothetical protein